MISLVHEEELQLSATENAREMKLLADRENKYISVENPA